MSNIKQKLINAGYVEDRRENYNIFKNTDTLFQKKVLDEKGIKYFINCWFYEKDGVSFQEDVLQFEVQFTMTDGEKCNVSPFYQDVEEVEPFIKNMWSLMGFGYYELYH